MNLLNVDKTRPTGRAAARGWLAILLLLQAGAIVVISSGYLEDFLRFLPLTALYFFAALFLVIAAYRVGGAPQYSLGWVRYAAGGALLWFMVNMAVPALVGLGVITGELNYGLSSSVAIIPLSIIILTIFTLALLLWYSRPVDTLPGLARRIWLALLCACAAVGLPFFASLWRSCFGYPLLRYIVVSSCFVGYVSSGVAWIVWPRLVARVFPSLVRLTTMLVLLYGIADSYLRYIGWHLDPSPAIEDFAIYAAPVVAYAMLMLALAHGRTMKKE